MKIVQEFSGCSLKNVIKADVNSEDLTSYLFRNQCYSVHFRLILVYSFAGIDTVAGVDFAAV